MMSIETDPHCIGESAACRPRRRAVRIVLAFLYLIAALAFGAYEWNAHSIFDRANRLEAAGKHVTAAMAYGLVLDKYPLSVKVVAARRGLDRVGDSASVLLSPGRDRDHAMLSSRILNSRVTDPMPLLALPAASIVLGLACVARSRSRPWMATACLLLGAAAAYTSLSLFARDGMLRGEWLQAPFRMYREAPMLPYLATYLFLALACLSTLTRRGMATPLQPSSPAVAVPPQSHVARGTSLASEPSGSQPAGDHVCAPADSLRPGAHDATSAVAATGEEATTDLEDSIRDQLEPPAVQMTNGTLLPLLMTLIHQTNLNEQERRRLREAIDRGDHQAQPPSWAATLEGARAS